MADIVGASGAAGDIASHQTVLNGLSQARSSSRPNVLHAVVARLAALSTRTKILLGVLAVPSIAVVLGLGYLRILNNRAHKTALVRAFARSPRTHLR